MSSRFSDQVTAGSKSVELGAMLAAKRLGNPLER